MSTNINNLIIKARSFVLRSFTISLFIFLIFATGRDLVSPAYAAEVKLFDQELQFVQQNNGFLILHANGEPLPVGVPNNWMSPTNYFEGLWQYRIAILRHPTGQEGKLQMCMWNMPGFDPENCAFNIDHSGVGVYYGSSNPSINGAINGGWARIVGGPLDFLNPINYRMSTVLRGPGNCVVTTKQGVPENKRCPEYWDSFKDMRFRLTVIMVSKGATFSGWDNYGFDDPPTSVTPTPPGPSMSPPEPKVSPYPTVPRAETDCYHTCVWDNQTEPYCKVRQSGNMCGVSADPAKCESIEVPFVCAYASFDCEAGYCDYEPRDTTTREQPIYCDVNGNPVTAATTGKLYTAVGCIPINNVNTFIKTMLPLILSICGGIAFLLIIYASFMIKTSAGDPRKLQAGRELLTAAMAGLLLVVFSVFILRIVGQNILQIPGL